MIGIASEDNEDNVKFVLVQPMQLTMFNFSLVLVKCNC
jgi:hypothetical protein